MDFGGTSANLGPLFSSTKRPASAAAPCADHLCAPQMLKRASWGSASGTWQRQNLIRKKLHSSMKGCIYIYIFLVFLHIFLMSRLETSGVARQRSLDKKASFWDLTMNADVFPIKGKGDFQPAMLDYRRVLP